MPKMKFLFGEDLFEITAREFCNMFALVLDQSADPEYQVCVKLLRPYKKYDDSLEFPLDEVEKASVFDSLGIKITIPEKKKGGATGRIIIGGNLEASNLVIGNENQCNHQCKSGENLTLILTGSGIKVSNL